MPDLYLQKHVRQKKIKQYDFTRVKYKNKTKKIKMNEQTIKNKQKKLIEADNRLVLTRGEGVERLKQVKGLIAW